MSQTRIETDSLGEVRVPAEALYGAQTQRAIDNFRIGSRPMPAEFIAALGLLKQAAAQANRSLGRLPAPLADAIERAAAEVAANRHDAQFPVDVYQTGSGTSSNMNANEVIARLAGRTLGQPVHPNDHVNCSQSSNDVVPSAIHVAARLAIGAALMPALETLAQTIERRAASLDDVVKTGRTHLMDAMPLRMSQEFGAWAAQLRAAAQRIDSVMPRLAQLAIGGTAVGTGVNADPDFGERVAGRLARLCGVDFEPAPDRFMALSCQDTAVELSGQLRVLAVALGKLANDLRWMNSGPLAGLGEISLAALQPGSSIMPGKVNPVIPEAVAMVCARVFGLDATIAIAGQSGNFQLNVMLPLVADSLLESIRLLAGACAAMAPVIDSLTVERERIAGRLALNPVLATALNPVLGYELAAAIAKRAAAQGVTVAEIAARMSSLDAATLERVLDPRALTEPGVPD